MLNSCSRQPVGNRFSWKILGERQKLRPPMNLRIASYFVPKCPLFVILIQQSTSPCLIGIVSCGADDLCRSFNKRPVENIVAQISQEFELAPSTQKKS